MTEPSNEQLAELIRRYAAIVHPEAREAFRLAALRLEARGEISEAINEVLETSDEFRKGMGPEWEGDPLTDACDRLRAALEAAQKGDEP